MRRALRTIVAASAVALASCSPPEIKVTTAQLNGRQVIRLTQRWGIFSHEKPPCIDRVDLSERGPKGKPIWRFEAKTQQCVDLNTFAIGEVPPGFVERIALPMRPRGRFDVLVVGIGMGEAQITLP